MTHPDQPLKVLHIGKYFPPYAGGMETYLRDLMAAQAKQGLDSAALVHKSELSLRSSNEKYPIGEHELPVTRAAVWLRLLFTPLSPTFPFLLNRLIKENKPDLLHLHMPNVSVFWALFLPSARNLPWVVQWQSDVLASKHSLGLRLFYSIYRPFERMVLRRSKAIIASSPPYLESSEPLADYRDKCHVVPLGLNPTASQNDRIGAETKPGDALLRMLAIGRLTYYKGFEFLIRAAAECDNTTIHIVGKGDQETHLRKLALELGLESRINFHGHLDDEKLELQFQQCDCLCLPSIERTESFGMVLLEAMQHGKPTVIANVPGSGMGWVVDDGITGLHSIPENAASLAKSLRQLRDNRDNIAQLGGSGREKLNRLFHIDVSAAGVKVVYQNVLGACSSN
jgi:rhamnosyl/mannosyltransferase